MTIFDGRQDINNLCKGVTFDAINQRVAVLLETNAIRKAPEIDMVAFFLSPEGAYLDGFIVSYGEASISLNLAPKGLIHHPSDAGHYFIAGWSAGFATA